MNVLKKKFRSVKKLPTWLFFFPALLLKIARRTLYKVKIDDPNGYLKSATPIVAATWHNRLLFFPAIFPREACERTRAVISPSRDGQYIADLASFFGLKSLRGSSSKKGAHAQRGAVQAVREGYHVCYTPDGPRGPKYRYHPGPVHLASITGSPLVPVSVNASRYWALKSWDRFQIPKPFSTLHVVLGEALYVPSKLTAEELERYRLEAERLLNAITKD